MGIIKETAIPFDEFVNKLKNFVKDGDWFLTHYDIDRPPKEITTKEAIMSGMKEFEPGPVVTMTITFERDEEGK